MVDYPTSIKAFSDIVDGTDFMEATQMNQAYDEIEALQTMLGAMGYAANQTDSLTSVLREYRHGCKVIADTVAQIKVNAGEVVCVDGSGDKKLRRNTSQTTVTWADIDTGSEDTSKRYYVHAVADSAATTFTVVISLSSTAPTGVTTFKLLGSFYNDSGDDITDVMDDLHLVNKEPGQPALWTTETPPGGALLCDGTAYDASGDETLDDLYAVIGNTFGGSDETDFQVPDLRGRGIIGIDDMGGSSANRVTDAQADSIGGTMGTETHDHEAGSLILPQKAYASSEVANTQYHITLADDNVLLDKPDIPFDITGDTAVGDSLAPSMALNVIIWK